jgi:anti-sigma B factor antagonist
VEVRVPDVTTTGMPYVVEVDGDVDIATVDDLEEPVIRAIEQGRRPVILDLTECPFMDSSGIRLLLRAHRLLHPDRNGHAPLLAVIARDHVASVLRLTSVDKVLPVVASRGEAEGFLASSAVGH